MNLEDYYGKVVKVVDNYGETHIGKVDVYTQPNDNDGEEALALSNGIWLDESDIKTIELA